jgi:hypothetical protein
MTVKGVLKQTAECTDWGYAGKEMDGLSSELVLLSTLHRRRCQRRHHHLHQRHYTVE